ncbi:MAG: VanZ family protein [Planctomycetes bacterium]|nr:VanZ family protein [Planctomycetota bacterium]
MNHKAISYFKWLPLIIWMSLIFYLSHQPSQSFEFDHSTLWGQIIALLKEYHLDKLIHASLYFFLGSFCALAKPGAKLGSLFFCILYGLSDEYHQTFIEGRFFDLLDLLADSLGAYFALYLMPLSFNKLKTALGHSNH